MGTLGQLCLPGPERVSRAQGRPSGDRRVAGGERMAGLPSGWGLKTLGVGLLCEPRVRLLLLPGTVSSPRNCQDPISEGVGG